MVENLKKLRVKTNISQQQLADVIRVSQQSINKYENHGVEPDIKTLIAMADYFSTSVDYLIGNTKIERKIENVQKYDLNDEEIQLIDGFRKLNPTEKEIIKLIISNNKEKRTWRN